MKALDDTVFASIQILPEDVAALAKDGIKTIINNRPDNEEPGQPSSAEMAAACDAAGITYHHIPMAGTMPKDLIDASNEAYKNSSRPIAAFCKSGTRSAALWCFAAAGTQGTDEALRAAAAAGYNLEQLRGGITGYLAMQS